MFFDNGDSSSSYRSILVIVYEHRLNIRHQFRNIEANLLQSITKDLTIISLSAPLTAAISPMERLISSTHTSKHRRFLATEMGA